MSYYLDADKFMDWILELIMDEEQKPYIDERINNTSWIRTFDPTFTESDEYVWHQDRKDRVITILEGDGWQFQFDEELPIMINRTNTIKIPKYVYHRLIIGKTKLRLKIEEVD